MGREEGRNKRHEISGGHVFLHCPSGLAARFVVKVSVLLPEKMLGFFFFSAFPSSFGWCFWVLVSVRFLAPLFFFLNFRVFFLPFMGGLSAYVGVLSFCFLV